MSTSTTIPQIYDKTKRPGTMKTPEIAKLRQRLGGVEVCNPVDSSANTRMLPSSGGCDESRLARRMWRGVRRGALSNWNLWDIRSIWDSQQRAKDSTSGYLGGVSPLRKIRPLPPLTGKVGVWTWSKRMRGWGTGKGQHRYIRLLKCLTVKFKNFHTFSWNAGNLNMFVLCSRILNAI